LSETCEVGHTAKFWDRELISARQVVLWSAPDRHGRQRRCCPRWPARLSYVRSQLLVPQPTASSAGTAVQAGGCLRA